MPSQLNVPLVCWSSVADSTVHLAVHPKTAVQRCSRDPYSRPQGLNTSNVEEPLPFFSIIIRLLSAGSVCLHLGLKLDRLHVPPKDKILPSPSGTR